MLASVPASLALDPAAVLQRLVDAANAHDLDGIVGCFADGYVNETPAHPARGFAGSAQVRANWTQILAAVPDLTLRVLGQAVAGDTVWCEQEMSGTRRDGSPHLMRGVVVFTAREGLITRARFYLEPVDHSDGGVGAAVAAQTGPAR